MNTISFNIHKFQQFIDSCEGRHFTLVLHEQGYTSAVWLPCGGTDTHMMCEKDYTMFLLRWV